MTKTLQSNKQSEVDAESVPSSLRIVCDDASSISLQAAGLPKKASRRFESSQWSLTPVALCVLVAGLTLSLWT